MLTRRQKEKFEVWRGSLLSVCDASRSTLLTSDLRRCGCSSTIQYQDYVDAERPALPSRAVFTAGSESATNPRRCRHRCRPSRVLRASDYLGSIICRWTMTRELRHMTKCMVHTTYVGDTYIVPTYNITVFIFEARYLSRSGIACLIELLHSTVVTGVNYEGMYIYSQRNVWPDAGRRRLICNSYLVVKH